ncbi:hypothetical protein [Rhizobium sp. R693]|uniref:hypothetical protein n=1 Tax=Rhizobium sp. R693 TaxID=1764276 RepID=UPI0011318CF2|nr:hypothetical protein [Rhizobium sp. R693]
MVMPVVLVVAGASAILAGDRMAEPARRVNLFTDALVEHEDIRQLQHDRIEEASAGGGEIGFPSLFSGGHSKVITPNTSFPSNISGLGALICVETPCFFYLIVRRCSIVGSENDEVWDKSTRIWTESRSHPHGRMIASSR